MDVETEALIRREVAKQVRELPRSSGGAADYAAEEYDFKAEPLTNHPGRGWLFTQCVPVGIHVVVIWRKLRVQQVAESETPRMAPPTK
jgi:hypothetical protein